MEISQDPKKNTNTKNELLIKWLFYSSDISPNEEGYHKDDYTYTYLIYDYLKK